MREKFKDLKFGAEASLRIEQANEIIQKFKRMGLTLTLRQLYYQFVKALLIPNNVRSYKNLGAVISRGRLAGLIDWDSIEDRIRKPNMPIEFESPKDFVERTQEIYRLPRRRDQDTYVELWVEKDALAGVLEPVAFAHHVPLMVNRGYSSQSAMYESAQRFIESEVVEPKTLHLLYIGDHDPSGEDMVRDVTDRLEMFGVDGLNVHKLALTMEQVRKFDLPPNPAKMSDSRASKYVDQHGDGSWEVDALPPDVLQNIIGQAIKALTDQTLVDRVLKKEKADKVKLLAAVKHLKG